MVTVRIELSEQGPIEIQLNSVKMAKEIKSQLVKQNVEVHITKEVD